MSYSASELLSVFGFYLDHGMAEAVRVFPMHKDFLGVRKDKTMYEVEVELLTPKKATTLLDKMTARLYRKGGGVIRKARHRTQKNRTKQGYMRRVASVSKPGKAVSVGR